MIATALALMTADPGVADSDKTRRIVSAYAECLVKGDRNRLKRLLEMPVGTSKTGHAWLQLNGIGSCLSDLGDSISLRFKPFVIRGPVYEELYRRDFGEIAVVDITGVSPLTYAQGSGDSDEARQYQLAMAIGDCVVRAAPGPSRALLLTEVATPAEQSKLSAVLPNISACLPAGQAVKFSKMMVRGMIAEPLYRLNIAKRSAPHA